MSILLTIRFLLNWTSTSSGLELMMIDRLLSTRLAAAFALSLRGYYSLFNANPSDQATSQ